MRINGLLSAMLISLSLLSASFRTVYAAASDDIEKLIDEYKRESKCQSVSLVLLKDGELTYYGDNESLYQIGSMTKAFTGLAIEKLIWEGLIDEDGRVSDYIEGFENYYDSQKVDISVRNLLEQKSGYTNSEKDYPSASETMTLSEWGDSISGLELKSLPGTEYAYSNVNYNLLGLIIENVTGMSYRDYMEEEVLIPLGLTDTYVGEPSGKKTVEGSRLGYRHAHSFSLGVKEGAIPAGYFYSNTDDMGRWIEIWTGTADIPGDLIEPLSRTKEYLIDEGDYFSGWEVFDKGVIGHSGGTANYSSRIVFDRNSATGVCVLTNLNVSAGTDSLCNSVFDIISGKEPVGLAIDIWTIFDRIFSLLTVITIVLIPIISIATSRLSLLITNIISIIILILLLILLPIIFAADMRDILFTWAPWSLTGGLLALAGVTAVSSLRLITVYNHGDHNKTGKR